MNKGEIIHSLLTIKFDKDMESELRELIGTTISLQTLGDAIANDICDKSIMRKISEIAPICYRIGDRIFLKGETKGEHDFVGDNLGTQPVTELFDMTTEMLSGDSYSFYVSDTSYFELAPCSEIIKVKKFLNNLYV